MGRGRVGLGTNARGAAADSGPRLASEVDDPCGALHCVEPAELAPERGTTRQVQRRQKAVIEKAECTMRGGGPIRT